MATFFPFFACYFYDKMFGMLVMSKSGVGVYVSVIVVDFEFITEYLRNPFKSTRFKFKTI